MARHLADQERATLSELHRSVEALRLRGTPLRALAEITERLGRDAAGLFAGVDMAVIDDMTDSVAAAEASVAEAFRVELSILKHIATNKRMALVCHSQATAWYFDVKALMGMKLALGELPAKSELELIKTTAHDAVRRVLFCPVVIFLPGFNEITLSTKFALYPDSPDALRGFEANFSSLLAKPASALSADPTAGPALTHQCGVCHWETTQILTRCEQCDTWVCSQCLRKRECPCGRQLLCEVPMEDINLASVIQLSDTMYQANQSEPDQHTSLQMLTSLKLD